MEQTEPLLAPRTNQDAEEDLRMPSRPYPGLRPFEESEAGIFFGREQHRNRLLEILQRRRFLAVIGPSGSGKSSLVRAGLLPILPLGAIGTGSKWRVATLRPGYRPLRSLAEELLRPEVLGRELAADLMPSEQGAAVALIEAALRRGRHSLLDLVMRAKSKAGCEEDNVLILVDQFEELFTYAEAGGQQSDESDSFVNLLLAASESPADRLFVAITMRTDFLGHCVRFADLPEAINHAQYLTPRLTRDEIRDAIIGPAETFGGSIESRLVEELINAVLDNPDQLPVLQHALARMWEEASERTPDRPQIKFDILDLVGGIKGALSKHGEDLLGGLTPSQRVDAEWLFRSITDERVVDGGGQRVRRPQTLKRIAAWSERPWHGFVKIIERFSGSTANFVTHTGSDEIGEDTVVDLSHEALMRQWVTLVNWVTAEADCAREFRRLRERMSLEKQGTGSLLTGGDLLRARAWLERGLQLGRTGDRPGSGPPTDAWASRYEEAEDKSFSDVARFVHKSDFRQRMLRLTLVSLGGLLIVVSSVTAWMAFSAYHEGLRGQAVALWDELRVELGVDRLPSQAKIRPQEIARATPAVREKFIGLGLEQTRLQPALLAESGVVTKAAIGLNDKMRADAASSLRKRMNEPNRNKLVDTALLGLIGETSFDDWRAALTAAGESKQRSQFLRAFGQAAAVATGTQREGWASRMLDLIRQPTTDADDAGTLGTALSYVLAQSSSTSAAIWAGRLYEEMKSSTLDSSRLGILNRAFAGSVKRLDASGVEAMAKRWAADARADAEAVNPRILNDTARSMTDSIPSSTLPVWGQVVRDLSDQVPSGVLDRLMARAADASPSLQATWLKEETALSEKGPGVRAAWANSLISSTPDDQLDVAFGLALTLARSDALAPDSAAKFASSDDNTRRKAFRQRLKQEVASAKEPAKTGLHKFLRTAKENDPVFLPAPPAPARSKPAASFDDALRDVNSTIDTDTLIAYGNSLAAAVQRLPDHLVREAQSKLLAEYTKSDDVDQRAALVQGMGAAAARMTEAARRAQFARLLEDARPGSTAISRGKMLEAEMQALILGATADEARSYGSVLLRDLAASDLAASSPHGKRSTAKETNERPARTATLLEAVARRLSGDSGTTSRASEVWFKELLQAKTVESKAARATVAAALAAGAAGVPEKLREQVFDALLSILAKGAVDDDFDSGSAVEGLTKLARSLPDAAAMAKFDAVASKAPAKSTLLRSLMASRGEPALVPMLKSLVDVVSHERQAKVVDGLSRLLILGIDSLSEAGRSNVANAIVRRLVETKGSEGAAALALSGVLDKLLDPALSATKVIIPDSELSRLLVEACKVPYVDRTRVADAVRRGDPKQAPNRDEGLWAFFRWATKAYEIDTTEASK